VLSSAARLLDEAVGSGVIPGAQVRVLREGAVVHRSEHGALARGGAPVGADALYDVASVTKVVATTAAAYVLLSRRQLSLEDRADRLVPGAAPITVRDLLAHTGGLPAWAPLFEAAARDHVAGAIFPGGRPAPRAAAFARAREVVQGAVTALRPVHPPGSTRAYSDLGFMLLGEVIAAAAGARLDAFCAAEIFGPLALEATRFHDLAAPVPEDRPVAATGDTRPREPAPGQEGLFDRPAQARLGAPGEVDDDNAYALSGVAGHAGVFSTADDLAAFGAAIVEELEGARRLGDPAVLRELCTPDRRPVGPPRALGFDVPAGEGSQAGARLGRGKLGAVGHLGFTGCSLWIDRDRRLVVALLTNRVHHGRQRPEGIRALRAAFHDAVIAALEGES
jgi:CubicO group peptidase (beta-lactamase class C family)